MTGALIALSVLVLVWLTVRAAVAWERIECITAVSGSDDER